MGLEFITVLNESTTSPEVRFMCGLGERFACMNQLTGGWKIKDGNMELTAPAPYPCGGPWVVKDVKISPIGEVFGSPPLVYLDVSYGFPKTGDKQQEEQQEAIERYSISASVSCEGLKIPNKKLKYLGESETLKDEDDAAVFVFISQIELSVKSDKCRGMNLSLAQNMAGHVNNSIFRVRDGGGMVQWMPECVLYMGLNGDTKFMTGEDNAYFDAATQDHKFLCRTVSWNKHFNVNTGTWKDVVTEEGSKPLYTPANLMSLFA